MARIPTSMDAYSASPPAIAPTRLMPSAEPVALSRAKSWLKQNEAQATGRRSGVPQPEPGRIRAARCGSRGQCAICGQPEQKRRPADSERRAAPLGTRRLAPKIVSETDAEATALTTQVAPKSRARRTTADDSIKVKPRPSSKRCSLKALAGLARIEGKESQQHAAGDHAHELSTGRRDGGSLVHGQRPLQAGSEAQDATQPQAEEAGHQDEVRELGDSLDLWQGPDQRQLQRKHGERDERDPKGPSA